MYRIKSEKLRNVRTIAQVEDRSHLCSDPKAKIEETDPILKGLVGFARLEFNELLFEIRARGRATRPRMVSRTKPQTWADGLEAPVSPVHSKSELEAIADCDPCSTVTLKRPPAQNLGQRREGRKT